MDDIGTAETILLHQFSMKQRDRVVEAGQRKQEVGRDIPFCPRLLLHSPLDKLPPLSCTVDRDLGFDW